MAYPAWLDKTGRPTMADFNRETELPYVQQLQAYDAATLVHDLKVGASNLEYATTKGLPQDDVETAAKALVDACLEFVTRRARSPKPRTGER